MEVTTILAIVSAVVSIGTAIYSSTLATGSDQEDVGAQITKTGTSATRNPVYGKCRVSSVNVYNNVRDHENQWLMSVFSFGIGPLEAVHQIYIDEVAAIPEGSYQSDPNGGTGQLQFRGIGDFDIQNVQIQIRSGLETENAMQLAIDYSDGEWTNQHRGDRCGQAAVRVKRVIDDEGARILNNQYTLAALVSGLKLFDPRIHSDPADPNQRAFSRNPALALLDYITDSYYGMGIPYKYIDLDSFIAAANYCSNDFFIDGEIDSSQAFSKIIGNILACFGGILIAEDGFVKVKYDYIAAPKYHFTEDNIISKGLKVTNQSTSGYYNVVETKFKNRNMDEKEDTFTLPADVNTDARVLKDGYIQSTTLEMPYTLDGDGGSVSGAVKVLTNRELRRSLYQKQVDFDVDLTEYQLGIYDVIEISNPHYGWVRRPFRITSMNKVIDEDKLNVATLSCMEYNSAVYTGNEDGNIGKPIKPQPPLSAPVNLIFNINTYITSGYGELSWQNTMNIPNLESHIEYKLKSDPTWTRLGKTLDQFWKVQNLRADTYQFRVRNYHPLRGATEWLVSDDVVISPTVILPEVTGTAADTSTIDFVITWDDMLDAPVGNPSGGPDNGGSDNTVKSFFSHYLVTMYHRNVGDNGWDFKKQYTVSEPKFVYLFSENTVNGINRKVRAEVQIVAKDGTTSTVLTNGASVDAENIQHSQVTGVDISAELGIVNMTWLPSNELDFRGTEVHLSETNGFTPDGSTLIDDINANFYTWIFPESDPSGKVYYLRLGSYDAFGTDDINFSIQYIITKKSIDDLLPEIGEDLDMIRSPYADDGVTKLQNPNYTIKAVDQDTVAGLGLIADEATSRTDAIIAADRVLFGAGGHPTWVDDKTYTTGQRVIFRPDTLAYEWLWESDLLVDNTPDTNRWGYVRDNNEDTPSQGALSKNMFDGRRFVLMMYQATNDQTYVVLGEQYNDGNNKYKDNDTLVLSVDGVVSQLSYNAPFGEYIVSGDVFSLQTKTNQTLRVRLATNTVQTKTSLLAEAIQNVPVDNAPSHNSDVYWNIINDNIDQAGFYHDADGRLVIESLVVDELHGNKILASTIQGDRIIANTIDGDRINATSRLNVGSITNQFSHVSGVQSDAAFAAGKVNKADTNGLFSVYHDGYMKATNGQIEGIMTVGADYSGAGQVRIQAGNGTDTNSHAIDIYRNDGGTDRWPFGIRHNGNTWWQYPNGTSNVDFLTINPTNGQVIMRGVNGTEFMKLDAPNNTATFDGDIQAKRLIGGVSGSKAVDVVGFDLSTSWSLVANVDTLDNFEVPLNITLLPITFSYFGNFVGGVTSNAFYMRIDLDDVTVHTETVFASAYENQSIYVTTLPRSVFVGSTQKNIKIYVSSQSSTGVESIVSQSILFIASASGAIFA